jgi:pimeloyl-ACP methyl ester carboxylesterase
VEQCVDNIEHHWGTPQGISVTMWAPSIASDPRAAEALASYLRASASPGVASTVMRMAREIDVRHILPATRVPTLILHRTAERVMDVEHARYMAQRIPGAKLVELSGEDHMPWFGDQDSILDEVEQFLTG